MMNIGIVCEGPTDFIVLRGIIDQITEEDNHYVALQPEPDLMGTYGNGWKGVWKWCHDNAPIKQQLMKDIEPKLDLLIIQMDGDVSRKEKAVHCSCKSVLCKHKGMYDPLMCDTQKEIRENCPIILPCKDHGSSVDAYREHLETLIQNWIQDSRDTCIVIPCDSTEAWIVAAYDERKDAETIHDPWTSVIAKKKTYHNIRISGSQKRLRVFHEFVPVICSNWKKVTELCASAKRLEETIIALKEQSTVSQKKEISKEYKHCDDI